MEWDFPARIGDEEGKPDLPSVIAAWKEEVRRHNLERVVFVSGGGNAILHQVVDAYPERFMGMVHHHPESPDALEELRRGIEEYGFVGYKMIGPRFSRPFEDPALTPIWRYLADREIPVLIHFGLLGKAGGQVYHPRMSPLTLWPVASEYSSIPFVIPHFGCGYIRELLHLCWSCPNVYVDTSGSNQWMRWEPVPLSLEDLFRRFYETIGPQRIIFGTDSSWLPRGFVNRYLQDQIRTCRQMNMPAEDLSLIFAGNARRLLKLEG